MTMLVENRLKLKEKYIDKIHINHDLNRSLVSFQANKKLPFFRWFKYKEGFSAPMMEYFISHSGMNGQSRFLDPFSGSGVALFSALSKGMAPTGIELLPIGSYVINNRLTATKVPIKDIETALDDCLSLKFKRCVSANNKFKHLSITKGAFSKETETNLINYLCYCKDRFSDENTTSLLTFAAFCILETISYTRKDGQYLRWDYRANKNQNSQSKFDKGNIPSFREAIINKLSEIKEDLLLWHSQEILTRSNNIKLLEGSVLELLPELAPKSLNIVITSPPYCNRYDYTRTYALELAFLGVGDDKLKALRQELLTCTVENHEKTEALRNIYIIKKRLKDYETIVNVFYSQDALQEVIVKLDDMRLDKKLNNPNIVRMVRNYFFEMCFVIFELYRIMKDNGVVYMVNDNVRYGGEEIPVDLILSDFAASAGFEVKNIWALNVGKGNSSQQMGAHGRSELRKCVYVWQK